MSIKYSNTTADYIEWNTMLNLVRRLYKDKKYRLSLLIGCGCFFRSKNIRPKNPYLESTIKWV